MNELVKNLATKDPHYVRCVKPNEIKSPQRFDIERVKHQVAYLGLVENIRVRKAGFAIRQPYDRFLARYKMINQATWPNHRLGSDRAAVKRINDEMGLKEGTDLEYGRTKLFIRSAQSLNKLEVKRTETVGKLIVFLQKHWRGTLQRMRYKKMIAALKIMAHYRKFKLRSYMVDLESRFRNVKSDPDRGKYIDWGLPPASIQATVDYFKLVFARWQAHFVLAQYPKNIHPDIELRCNLLDQFRGKRPNWQAGEWSGNYLASDSDFNNALNGIRAKNSIGKVLFTGKGLKMGKAAKSAERAIVITEEKVLKIDTKKNKLMDTEPISSVTGVSIFDYDGSKTAILHCSGRNDLVMVFASGNVVDLCARLTPRLKVNLLPGPIPVTFEKKTLQVTRGDSVTGQAHYTKGATANAIVAME